MKENIMKGPLTLLDVINVIATLVRTVIAVLSYVREIDKDEQQKSNRPDQG